MRLTVVILFASIYSTNSKPCSCKPSNKIKTSSSKLVKNLSTKLIKKINKNAPQTIGIFMEKDLTWGTNGFYKDLKNANNFGYNLINIGFYSYKFGCTSGCQAWEKLSPNLKSKVKSESDVYLSVGGPSEPIENMIKQQVEVPFTTKVVKYAIKNHYSGVDFFLNLMGVYSNNHELLNNGKYSKFMQNILDTVDKLNTDLKISITVQAPYFNLEFTKNWENSLTRVLAQYPNVSVNLLLLNDHGENLLNLNAKTLEEFRFGSVSNLNNKNLKPLLVNKVNVLNVVNISEGPYGKYGTLKQQDVKKLSCTICSAKNLCSGTIAWTFNNRKLSNFESWSDSLTSKCDINDIDENILKETYNYGNKYNIETVITKITKLTETKDTKVTNTNVNTKVVTIEENQENGNIKNTKIVTVDNNHFKHIPKPARKAETVVKYVPGNENLFYTEFVDFTETVPLKTEKRELLIIETAEKNEVTTHSIKSTANNAGIKIDSKTTEKTNTPSIPKKHETTKITTEINTNRIPKEKRIIPTTGIFIEKHINWGWKGFYKNLQFLTTNGFNNLNIGFYMYDWGCRAACQAWKGLNNVEKASVKEKAKVFLTVGGPGESLNRLIKQGELNNDNVEKYVSKAINLAKIDKYDGINFYFHEHGQASRPSNFFREKFPNLVDQILHFATANSEDLIISITTPAVYFNSNFYGKINLSLILQKYQNVKINLIMYNEGSTFQTKNDIFIKNENSFSIGNSVAEIAKATNNLNEINIVKPIGDIDSPNFIKSGSLNVEELKEMRCSACSEGVCSGVIGWTFDNRKLDLIGEWGSVLSKKCGSGDDNYHYEEIDYDNEGYYVDDYNNLISERPAKANEGDDIISSCSSKN